MSRPSETSSTSGAEIIARARARRQRFGIGGPFRQAGQRQVEIESFACTFAALIGKAEKCGKAKAGIGVDGDEQHIAAGVENRLRAVAVMVVHIEDGGP